MGKSVLISIVLSCYEGVLIKLSLLPLKQSWRQTVENLHSPSPQPEDHARDEDPGFDEDPEIYIEFDDGVFYQPSLDGSEVAITADYPDLFPFAIVSVRKASSKRESSLASPSSYEIGIS